MSFRVHFIGIGGVSLSSLAKYMLRMGFTVSGSDARDSVYTEELKRLGASVFIGHSEKNAEGAQVVVYSDAIKEDNCELAFARKEKLFIMTRAELLKSVAENFGIVIGVAGCNGKTTVTCMLAHILDAAKKAFTAHIGGEDKEFSNSVIRGSEVFLSEVCEYKKNLLNFPADVCLCLNCDADHLDCYNGYDELKNAYLSYLKSGDKAVINIDDPVLAGYKEKNAVTFGVKNKAKYGVKNLTEKNGAYSFYLTENGRKLTRIALSVAGEYNAVNALAACALAREIGVSAKDIARGIKKFKGVKRRYERIGKINGADVIIDYAHHPKEIAACLSAAKKERAKNILVVFQPHTYSRTIFLKDEFIKVLGGVENLYLFRTFAAREAPIEGGSALDLYKDLGKGEYFDDFDKLFSGLTEKLDEGDLLLVLGAGDLAELFRSRLAKE